MTIISCNDPFVSSPSSPLAGMFPGGAADLANYFYAKCNSELRAELEAASGDEIPSQTAFVRYAMIIRLKMTLRF